MIVIEKSFQSWQPDTKKQVAKSIDDGIDEDCVIIDKENQQIVALQLRLSDQSIDTLKNVSRTLRYDLKWKSEGNRINRLSGISSFNKVFGTLQPSKLRQRFGCKSAALNRDQPYLVSQLYKLAVESFEKLKEHEPHRANDHNELVKTKIHKDWLMSNTPFSSGIINYSAALPYHRDSGNIKGSWSAMVCSRKNMTGGNLHLPEYDITLGVPNNSLIWFNGQTIWHGVTPMKATHKNAYRFTIVYYAKNGVCECSNLIDEPVRAAKNAMRSVSPLVKK